MLVNNNVIGLVSLSGIGNLNSSADFYITIGDISSQNKEVGTFAINEMLYHAFNNLNITWNNAY